MNLKIDNARLISNNLLRFLDDSISKHHGVYHLLNYPGIVNKIQPSSDHVKFCDLRFFKD